MLPESITNGYRGVPGEHPHRNILKNNIKKTAISQNMEVAVFLMRLQTDFGGMSAGVPDMDISSFFFRQEELFESSNDIFPGLCFTKMLCFFFDPLEHVWVGEHQVNEIVVTSLAVPE